MEETAAANQVSELDLLLGVRSLLSGSALSWFRATKERIFTWKAFKKNIREAYQPGDGDEAILDRIRKMRQKDDETYVLYAARMEDQFRRLEEPLTPKKKVRFLMKGLHVFYKNKICEEDINSEAGLRRACRKWEAAKVEIQRREREKERCEKGRQDRDKDDRPFGRPERARRAADTHAVGGPLRRKKAPEPASEEEPELQEEEPETSEEFHPHVAAATLGPKTPVAGPFRSHVGSQRCWRCGESGHISLNCKTEIFCISCGQQGVVAERCQRCVGGYANGLTYPPPVYPMPGMPNFPMGAWSWGAQVPPRSTAPPLDMGPPPATLPPPIQPRMMYPTIRPRGAPVSRAAAPPSHPSGAPAPATDQRQ